MASLTLIDAHLFEIAAVELEASALRAVFERDLAALHGGTDALPQAALERHFAVFRAHMRAAAAYRPAPYDGPVHYLQAEDAPAEVAAAWRPWTPGGLHVTRLPGDHYGMMRAPHVATLAAAVRAAWRRP